MTLPEELKPAELMIWLQKSTVMYVLPRTRGLTCLNLLWKLCTCRGSKFKPGGNSRCGEFIVNYMSLAGVVSTVLRCRCNA